MPDIFTVSWEKTLSHRGRGIGKFKKPKKMKDMRRKASCYSAEIY